MITKYYEPAEKVGSQRQNLFSIKSLVQGLNPAEYDKELVCHQDGHQAKDCQSCYMQPECFNWDRLIEVFTEPYIACFCNEGDGASEPKTGHRPDCELGEVGRKLRRQIEDRLRKDPLLILWVSRIIGLSR